MVKKIRLIQWHTKTPFDGAIACPYCLDTAVSYPVGSSANIAVDVMRYYCESCGKQFNGVDMKLEVYDSVGNVVGSGFLVGQGTVASGYFQPYSIGY